MILLSIQNLSKSFAMNTVLKDVNLTLQVGERMGLVGVNGSGKSTLFRLISGEMQPDEGSISLMRGTRVGVLTQDADISSELTVQQELERVFEPVREMERRLRALEAEMAEKHGDPEEFERLSRDYSRLTDRFEDAGGYEWPSRIQGVLAGLGFARGREDQPSRLLSGGEKTRLCLARLLLTQPDLLMLDEPTNHLDLRATEWLEDYLLKFKGTVLTISHDRYFLDRVVGRIVEIVGGRAEFYNGNYSFYVAEKEARFEEQLKKYEKEQKEIKRLEESAQRLYQWGTGNERLMQKSQAIRTRIERTRKTERPTKEKTMSARFGEREFYSDELFTIKGLKKAFGEKVILKDAELSVTGGERIALIGDNGTGKSTFINMLMGLEDPDAGYIKLGPAVKSAYLEQQIHFAHTERSVLDTMIYETNCSPQTARNRLGAFKFSGEDVFKPVWALSGGELSRLRLCILMREDINFLILDEPTNHLDIASREWIEEALADYGEALLFVSHDRYFINRFAERIWELRDGEITDFRGSFEQFRAFKAREQKQEQVKKEVKRKETKKTKAPSAEKQAARLEKQIAEAEAEIKRIDAEIEEFSADYEKLSALFEEKQTAEAALERLYDEWAQVAE